ncbi:MAG: EAL domain-containing protein [Burkholderiales bacterium]|nr:EAL domain-containing protein [Burkholderiales bacterium]
MLENSLDRSSLILIVDDSESVIHVLYGALADCGEVLIATDGQTALDIARQRQPDLILLDVEMPGLNGYEVCERLKADRRTAESVVIFVTSRTDELSELRALKAGAVDFITKPLNLPVVRARVTTHLTLKQQADALSRSQRDLHALIDNIPALVSYWDTNLHIRFGNHAYREWFGRSPDDVKGKTVREVIGADLHAQDALRMERALAGDAQAFEREIPCADGKSRHAQVHYVPDVKDGHVRGFFVLITDITTRKRAEQAVFQEMDCLRVTLNSIGDAVIACDDTAIVTFMNPIAEAMTGWTQEDAKGQPIDTVMQLRDGPNGDVLPNPVHRALQEGSNVGAASNAVLLCRDGTVFGIKDSASPIADQSGVITGAITVFHDISETRAMALKMMHLAQYDALTDLPNRTLLQDRIAQAIQHAQRSNGRVGLLLLDLDHFKYVNDSLGHAAGDDLLQAIAKRLTHALRATDTVSRQGGDEFVVVLPQVGGADHVSQVADKLLEALSRPYDIDGTRYSPTFSMGISLYPDDGDDHDSLLQHADAAMYRAKEQGRNRYQFYCSEIGDLMRARHALERHMRDALEEGLFTVHYQPQVLPDRGYVVGMEALVRWRRPDGTLVSPAQFIPLAEECGLIVPLGKYVMLEACRQAQRWREAGLPPVRIAVNISAAQFAEKDFAVMVRTALAETGLDARWLELEITESTMLIDANRTRAVLEDLKGDGISVAIDDFGTGYSSLAYLKRFPVDVLKIDRSFIHDALTDTNGAAIVSAIVSMGRSLGLDLVAEGVETEAQADYLQSLGCPVIMQGFLYSRPCDAEKATEFLAHWSDAGPICVPGRNEPRASDQHVVI